MEPATVTIASSLITLIVGKLIDRYCAKSDKYPNYEGIVPYTKKKLKKGE